MTNNVGGLLFYGADTPPTITIGGDIPGGTAWEYQYEVFYVSDGPVPQLSRKYLGWNGSAMGILPAVGGRDRGRGGKTAPVVRLRQ